MHDTRNKTGWDGAVSPVIGVLLMLVVTIIIAAVVSGFAGGLVGGEKKAPTLAATVTLELTGDKDSRLMMKVDSASEPIPSKDLKIVTSWSKTTSSGIVKGGNTTIAGNYYPTYKVGAKTYQETQPFGFGPGTESWAAYGPRNINQTFGNYTFEAGTTAVAGPYRGKLNATSHEDLGGGYGPRLDPDTGIIVGAEYQYQDGTQYKYGTNCDGMQGVLGYNWNVTRPGDIVNVKIIHIPSQKTIYDKDIVATGRTFI